MFYSPSMTNIISCKKKLDFVLINLKAGTEHVIPNKDALKFIWEKVEIYSFIDKFTYEIKILRCQGRCEITKDLTSMFTFCLE